MNSEETERMKVLCEQIQTEQDHKKFAELLLELRSTLRIASKPKRSFAQIPGTRCAVCWDFSRLKYADVQTNP
jgi:hypothetical protein